MKKGWKVLLDLSHGGEAHVLDGVLGGLGQIEGGKVDVRGTHVGCVVKQ